MYQAVISLILVFYFRLSCSEPLAVTVPLDAQFKTFIWRVHNSNKSYDLVAEVPGGVHTALKHNANIGEPYYRFRDEEYRWIVYDNWTYYRDFNVTKDFLTKSSVFLVSEGLDTVASVFINGEFVGNSSNMFIRNTWNVKTLLKEGINNISVAFVSAPTYAEKKFKEHSSYDIPPDCPPKVQHGLCHPNFIRKEQCSFSWDWGPAFAPQGIWKNLSIEAYDAAVIRDVTAFPMMKGGKWSLNVTVYFDLGALPAKEMVNGRIDVSLPFEGIEDVPINLTQKKASFNAMLTNLTPDLWWPNGFGKQTLYPLIVIFTDKDGHMISNMTRQVGFRHTELVQEVIKGSEGFSFYFRINKRTIFIKGSNWIPADAFQERVDRVYLRRLLQSVVDANMHALRVWGGGIYEQDAFYEICNELGILIWQDVMFGCAMYPAGGAFLESVREEVQHQVRRIGSHPCILIWAGNNENEVALRDNWYNTIGNFSLYQSDYVKLYIDTVRDEITKHTTMVPFVSSSPSNGVQSKETDWVAFNPQDPHYGDVHYYNYIENCWDLSHLPKPRFASEYGYQSWPSFQTLQPVSVKEDWDMVSDFSTHRQHHLGGNLEMTSLVLMHFNVSDTEDTVQFFKDTIYLMQISQALCIKFETEHYRRLQSLIVNNEGHCMGALYWQLNDIWQAPTWASIEYGGKWKMLHHFAQDFFAPILASGMEEDGKFYVYSITDIEDLLNATLVITLRRWDNMNFNYTWSVPFTQNAPSSKLIFKKPTKSLLTQGKCPDRESCFFTLQILRDNSQLISPINPFYLSSFNKVKGLMPPKIAVSKVAKPTNTTFQITLTTQAIAPFTWLDTVGIKYVGSWIPGRFSQNGFLFLEPEMTVTFYAWQDTKLQDFQTSLYVTSLMDLYSSPKKRKSHKKMKWMP